MKVGTKRKSGHDVEVIIYKYIYFLHEDESSKMGIMALLNLNSKFWKYLEK
jgi:hypothetical protein